MKICLIVIGNEILKGRISDLNVQFLAQTLLKNQLLLNQVTIIPDDKEIIKSTVLDCFKQFDVIVTCGGVGPTEDDLTPIALKEVFKDKIVEVKNNFGFAPGLSIYQNSPFKLLLSLPGVPREFSGMVLENLIPKLNENKNNKVIKKEINIRTEGVMEETIFFKLCPTLWKDLEKFSTNISSLPRIGGVDIVVEIEDKIEIENELIKFIYSTPLNEYIWHIGNESPEELVIKLCLEHNLTISLAESCTGGLTSHLLTNVPKASNVLKGSIISYTDEVKSNLLKINNSVLTQSKAVSYEVAELMAQNCREIMNSDIAISLTGLAGPYSEGDNHPVGTLFVGVAQKNKKTIVKQYSVLSKNLSNNKREMIKQRFALKALYLLLNLLKQFPHHS